MSSSAATPDMTPSGQTLPPALLLTVPEAAKMLRIGRSKVFELIKRGELQSVKIDNVRLFPPSFLEAYVAGLIADASR
jgi:excisionase family DNA binding protein